VLEAAVATAAVAAVSSGRWVRAKDVVTAEGDAVRAGAGAATRSCISGIFQTRRLHASLFGPDHWPS
jgi:hypothetical protein